MPARVRRPLTAEQRAKHNARNRERYANNPESRVRIRTPERQEKYNAHNRERRANDPEYHVRQRERAYRRKYGITTAQYDRIFAALGGKCPLCKVKAARATRRLAVHHDHALDAQVAAGEITKAATVVTLLCGWHNRRLRLFGDSAAGLRAAADALDAAERITRAVIAITLSPGEHDALMGEYDDVA